MVARLWTNNQKVDAPWVQVPDRNPHHAKNLAWIQVPDRNPWATRLGLRARLALRRHAQVAPQIILKLPDVCVAHDAGIQREVQTIVSTIVRDCGGNSGSVSSFNAPPTAIGCRSEVPIVTVTVSFAMLETIVPTDATTMPRAQLHAFAAVEDPRFPLAKSTALPLHPSRLGALVLARAPQ